MDLNEARKRLPELAGLSDESALNVIHQVYYPNMDRAALADRLGFKAAPPPVPERSMARAAGDLGLQFAGGAVSGVRMMSDLFGADNAVSGGLRGAEDALRDLQSAAAKADQQRIAEIMKEAESKGFGDQVIAGVKAFGQAPAAMIAQALGTSVPTLATALIPGAGQGAMAARLAAGAGVGAAQGAGNIKGVIYEEIKNNPLPGETPEQTEFRAVRAQEYGGQNTGQIALGGGLGALAGTTGMERALSGLRNGVTQAAPGMVARAGMGAAAEAVPEIAQGGQEKLAGNLALRNEGFDVDPMAGVVAGATMEGLAGGLTGGMTAIPLPHVIGERDPVPVPVPPVEPPGPMTKAVNALGPRLTTTPTTDLLGRNTDPLAGQMAADRLAAEDAAVTRQNFADRNGAMLAGGGLDGSRADPLANMLADARTSDANSFTNVQQAANRRPPMPASDAARILDEAKNRGMDLTAAPHPDGGFVVVPRQWVTPDVAAQAETEIADTLARMQQADAAPVERAERRRSEPVDLNLNTDPVAGYIEDLRNTNTPAARAYVGEFDAGRVTRADVEQRMQAERGKTADERLAEAAAEGVGRDGEGLILSPSGKPFATKRPAMIAAEKNGGQVVQVDGGFAVERKNDDESSALTHREQKAVADVHELARNETKVSERELGGIQEVRGQGDFGLPEVGGELRGVSRGYGESTEQGTYAGSDRQLEGLRAGERALGNANTAGEQQDDLQDSGGFRQNANARRVGGRKWDLKKDDQLQGGFRDERRGGAEQTSRSVVQGREGAESVYPYGQDADSSRVVNRDASSNRGSGESAPLRLASGESADGAGFREDGGTTEEGSASSSLSNVQYAPQAANDTAAETPPVEAPAPARGYGAAAAGVPDAGAGAGVRADGVNDDAPTAQQLRDMPIDTKEQAKVFADGYAKRLAAEAKYGQGRFIGANEKPWTVANVDLAEKNVKANEAAELNYWQKPYEEAIKEYRFQGLPRAKWEAERKKRGLPADLSKNPQELNTSAEPAQKTAESEQVEPKSAEGGKEELRRQLRDVENKIVGAAGLAPDFIEDAMKSRKVPAALKKQRKEIKEQLKATPPAESKPNQETAQVAEAESIVVKEGKGLIKGKYLVEVDGDGAPGGPWDTPEQAMLAGEEWKRKTIQNAKDTAQERARWDAIAEKLKAGQEVTTAEIELLGLKAGTSDVRWFFPIAARLFNITSRDIRPIVKALIRDSLTDMGAKREFVPTRKALEAVAADVAAEQKPEPPKATELTPKQFHDAKLAYIAADTGADMAEVREMYDTEGGRADHQREWLSDVEAAAKAGETLTRQTLDKLYELAPTARLPETATPSGYQRPEARRAEAEEAQARIDNRKAAKESVKAEAAQEFTPADAQAAERQIAQMIGDRIDAMQAQAVQKIGAKFLPTMGIKAPIGKAKIKAAVTDFTKVNPLAAASEFGVGMADSVRAPLLAQFEGRLVDAAKPAAPAQQEATQATDDRAKPEPITPTAGKVDDFGEKLPPARRAMAAKLSEELTDDAIASQPLSKVWPLEENEAIEDTFAAAVAHVMREAVPAKPRTSYKVKSWVSKVKVLRDFAAKILRGTVTKDIFLTELAKYSSLRDLGAKIKLLEQIDREQWKRIGDVSEAPGAIQYVDGKAVPQPSASVTVDGRSHWFRNSGDINDHLEAIKAMLTGDAPESKLKFEVFRATTGDRKVFISKKGDKEYRRLMEFDTVEEARKALKDQYADLVAAWEGVKSRDNITERDLRTAENRPRTGKDHRKGRDISAEEFQQTFGFRGGEFGKWVSQGNGAQERQFMLNSAYDALMDLSDIIGVPPKAISLDGTLGVAFGSRGGGWASAHFEPSNLVINLTKPRGAGALAHEWFHALDNYFARKRGGEVPIGRSLDAQNEYRRNNFITHKTRPMMVRKDGKGSPVTRERLAEWRKSSPGSAYLNEDQWIEDPNHKPGVRAEVEERFDELVKALDASPMLKRARKIDGVKLGDGYWSRTLERAARAFENYIQVRMHEQGYNNDFLVNVKPAVDVGKSLDRYPYLLPSEVAPIADAFSNLFNTIQTKEEDGKTVMFSIDDTTPAFYSALKREINRLPTNAAPAFGWLSSMQGLVKNGKVKADELEWSGLNEWLKLQTGKVSKEDVLAFLDANGVQVTETVLGGDGFYRDANGSRVFDDETGDYIGSKTPGTKYQNYTLPGGENYREVLLTLPQSPRKARFDVVSRKDKSILKKADSREEAQAWIAANAGMPAAKGAEVVERPAGAPTKTEYKSSHWDQPNVLAHIRVNDRTDAQGRKVLFVEEIQSDWGQDGKKKGFTENVEAKTISVTGEELTVQQFLDGIGADAKDWLDGRNAMKEDLGEPPLKPSDKLYSLFENGKRVMVTDRLQGSLDSMIAKRQARVNAQTAFEAREAAARNASKIPAAPFVDKTDKWLALSLKRIMKMAVDGGYDRVAFVTGDQSAERYDLSKQISKVEYLPQTKVLRAFDMNGQGVFDRQAEPEQLEDFIGKDVAKKLLESTPYTTGSGKQVHRLEGVDLKVGGEGMKAFYDKIVPAAVKDVLKKVGGGQMEVVEISATTDNFVDQDTGEEFPSGGDAVDLQQPGFTITPQMREKVAGGLPLFSSVDGQAQPADTADYGPATQAHRDAAARLAESFADRIENGGSHTDLLDAVAPGDGKHGQAAAAVASIARRLFRRQVVFVKFKGTPLFNGVVSKSVPGVVFLNIDSQKPLLSVLGHELLHEMAKSHPTMYANLSRRLDDLIKNETEYAVRTYNAYKKAGISTKGLDTREELEADIVGDNFMDAGFWQAMGENQPGLFKRIVNFVTKWLDNLAEKIADYRPFGTDEFLTDIAAARDAVAGAMREFSGAEAGAVADPVDGDVKLSAAEKQDQTQTAAFKKWFAGSKVVDSKGSPMVVYHGSPSPDAIGEFQPKNGGIYFSNDRKTAEEYTAQRGIWRGRKTGAVTEAFVALKTPLVIDAAGKRNDNIPVPWQQWKPKAFGNLPAGALSVQAVAEYAEANGYDGLIVRNVIDTADIKDTRKSDVFVAFNSSQVKSATGNRGTFDPDNADIRFSVADDIKKALPAFDVKTAPKNSWAHYRGMAMQALGRRQIVDLYAEELPQLAQYDYLVQKMDAEKNDSGAEADKLAQDWGKLRDEKQLAELMHDATLAQIDPAKPMETGVLQAQYRELKARFDALTPEAQSLYRQARDMYDGHYRKVQKAIKERIERSEMSAGQKRQIMAKMDEELFKKLKGVYFPLARFGQYVIVVKDANGEVKNVTRAETVGEAEEARKELHKAFPKHMGYTVGKVLKQAEFNAGRDAVGKGFMADLMDALDAKGIDDELRDTVAQLYLSSLPDLSWAKHGIHRKGTPGFSQDARRAFAQNMFHGARYLAKLRYADQLQDELIAMQDHVKAYEGVDEYDSIQAQQVVDEMVKRHEIMMNPKSSPVSTALTSLGFVFHLGLSPASAMVNLSQTALVAYPMMGAKWGWGKASAALLAASQDVVKAKNDLGTILKGAELDAYERAVKDGTIDVTMAHDLAGISQGEDQKVFWKIRPVMRAASFMFHHAERFNRQATFIAAWRMAKEAGPDKTADQLYEEAKKLTYDSHFDYSAGNRPRMMQGNWQRVIFLFRQYSQAMVYTLSRNAYLSMKGLTPADRALARKNLGGILATHAAAAGVLGLPLVGPLLTAASFIGSDDDEPWDAEVAMQNVMADMVGPKAAEVMARGFSRLTPFDLSGRVALNKLILPDVQEGLEGKQWAESAMAAALGPVAGIGVNMARGFQKITEGHYMTGLEDMMPTALRAPLRAMRYASEGAVDKTGVVIADEVGPGSIAGQALGFSPSEVRRATERKAAIMDYDRSLADRRSSLVRQWAEAQMAGDTDGVKDVMAEIQGFNQKNPNRKITMPHLIQSVRARRRRIEQAEDGVYLPKNREGAREAVRF